MEFSKDLILIIDDDESNLQFMSTILQHELKTQVECKKNPKEAFEYLKTTKPTLIILDMQMPVMDGLTALKYLRTFPSTEKIPVIACTALASKDLILRLVQLGIMDYLVKPLEKDAFVEKIGKHLSTIHGDKAPTASMTAT